MTLPASLLALDWGSSRLRAERHRPGRPSDRREAPWGILQNRPADLEAALAELCGDWLTEDPDMPVLVSGMAGSAEGWVQVPHCPVPAGPAELAARLVVAPSRRWPGRIRIVPGVRQEVPLDLMRGEEVQVLGALEALGQASGLFCLPGTHSKWVVAAQGRIQTFRTFLTGELFAAVLQLGAYAAFAPEPGQDLQAFERGLARARAGAGLLQDLFSIRAEAVALGHTTGLGDTLSGLLLGHELLGALAWAPPGPVVVAGEGPLCARYALALEAFGRPPLPAPADVHVRGLRRVLAAVETHP